MALFALFAVAFKWLSIDIGLLSLVLCQKVEEKNRVSFCNYKPWFCMKKRFRFTMLHLLFPLRSDSKGKPNVERDLLTLRNMVSKLLRSFMYLKLYCGYKNTRPCMINCIWGLKQLWLQVNCHAWFHLHGLRWPVRNGEGAKHSKEYIRFQRESNSRNATPRQVNQRVRQSGTTTWWSVNIL